MLGRKELQESRQISVWEWRQQLEGPENGSTGAADLRRAALLQAAVMTGVGALLYFFLEHRVIAFLVWSLAGLSLLLGLLHPPAFRPLHRFGQWLGRVIGTLLLYVLLVPFFFLFFFGVALLLRWQKRDPMQRSFLPSDLTYWIQRRIESPPSLYKRQFLREDKRARGLRRPVGSGGSGGSGSINPEGESP